MFLSGIGTAVPSNCYTQVQCWDALQTSPEWRRLSARSRAILRKVLLGNNGIDSRHLVLNPLAEAFDLNPDRLHQRFQKHAPSLAAEAARRALADAALAPAEIEALVVSTCTGYLCPGLTSYVSERLGLGRDILALDLVGQGCGAALPNLRTSESLLASGRFRKALSVCVEVCSAAFYLDDDPGVLVSACLFGDGAGAAVLTAEPGRPDRVVEWIHSESWLTPAQRDLLRFEQKGGMLRNILTPQVPALAADQARLVFDRVKKRTGIAQDQIRNWIWHAGGRDVLTALSHRFGLTEQQMRWSASILRELGNISSPFVLHVLERALRGSGDDGYWWMASFGAGFSSHGALLRVNQNRT
jgi:predicted naringenin-chalcone synthase